jgi:hypothetical protein
MLYESIDRAGLDYRLNRFEPVFLDVLGLIAREQEIVCAFRPHPTDDQPDRSIRMCGKKTYLMGTNCYFVGGGVLQFD